MSFSDDFTNDLHGSYSARIKLPNAPSSTTGFHEYRFDYLQDPISGEASVAFYADGREMMSWNTSVPRTSMHLMLNSWFPRWLDGRRPKKNAYVYVNRIAFEAQQ